jgi:ribosome-binding factor A
MSERTRKVESLIHRSVAAELTQLPEAARLTVTGVQVAPDLRNATVRIGILADNEAAAKQLFADILPHRGVLQEAVARQLATKFVPRITLEHDLGGRYAQHITELIRGL